MGFSKGGGFGVNGFRLFVGIPIEKTATVISILARHCDPYFWIGRSNLAIEKSQGQKAQTPLKTLALLHEISRRLVHHIIKNPDRT